MPNLALMVINLSTLFSVNASSDRIVELMEVPITEPGTEVPFSLNKGQIDVNNVYFAYPTVEDFEVPVLKNVSINVSKEQRVIALVGSSGSGKSSIISLIEQFYQPTQG